MSDDPQPPRVPRWMIFLPSILIVGYIAWWSTTCSSIDVRVYESEEP